MGQNSTDVAYHFGQMGSAYTDLDKPIVPPQGMVIVAIQFINAASINLTAPFGILNAVQSNNTSPSSNAPRCCLDAVMVGFISTVKNFPILFIIYFVVHSFLTILQRRNRQLY